MFKPDYEWAGLDTALSPADGYANAALQGAVLGMQKSLRSLKANGRLDEDPNLVVPFNERQRLVDKPLYDELEKKYTC